MNNKTWCVKFENYQTGEIAYREYPQTSQWSKREGICKMLQTRTFLTEFVVTDIRLVAIEKAKHDIAAAIGSLIYA